MKKAKEEQLIRAKTAKQQIKATKNLKKLRRKGKLTTVAKNKLKYIQSERNSLRNKRLDEIQNDWVSYRKEKEMADDVSCSGESDQNVQSFGTCIDKLESNTSDSEDEMGCEKMRKFDSKKELLPIKIDGKILKRSRNEHIGVITHSDMEQKSDENTGSTDVEMQDQQKYPDAEAPEEAEFEELEHKIITSNKMLVCDSQANISKLHELFRLTKSICKDAKSTEHIRELAIVSLTEVFINIVPGYNIRELTEHEKKQPMKKETRGLVMYEQNVLECYQKFIKMLSKNLTGLFKTGNKKSSTEMIPSISLRMSILSYRCLCNILQNLSHFNCLEEIVNSLLKLTNTQDKQIVDEICNSIVETFKKDYEFKISLKIVKIIAQFVHQKKCYVYPDLVATFLHLNIKEVDFGNNEMREKHQRKEIKRKIPMNSYKHKTQRKFDKQVRKLEVELEEALTNKNIASKLKFSTETMKFVFLTYFRILKRMPDTSLLGPVLEGLNKYVHLINIEFLDELFVIMGKLVRQPQLKLTETLQCIRTTCTILVGQGQILNIDLNHLYRSLYSSIPRICFETKKSALDKQMELFIDCMELLIIKNRRNMPINRVISFTKRLLIVALVLPTQYALTMLAIVRQIFSSFPGLRCLADEDDVVATGLHNLDGNDPDQCATSGTSFIDELAALTKHHNPTVRNFAASLTTQTKSKNRQSTIANHFLVPPKDYLLKEEQNDSQNILYLKIKRSHREKLTSGNICSRISSFIESNRIC